MPLLPQQLADQLGVVEHPVVPAEGGVLVLDGVEAMRALGDDRLHPQPVPGLDVPLGQRLVQVLVAQPASGVAVAHLLLGEGGEADPALAEDAHQGPADLLLPVVVAPRAPDEEEVLVLTRTVPDGKLEVGCPLVPLLLGDAPGVALALHALEDPLDLLGGKSASTCTW